MFFKNETITYEVYRSQFIGGIGASIFFYLSFALNISAIGEVLC